jgi:hypothetical protein
LALAIRRFDMKRLFQLSAIAACLLLGNGSPFVTAQDQDERGPDNHDLQFVANMGARRVLVQTKSDALTTTSETYTQLTAGSITIPVGQTGYLVATFSGESICTGGNWCTLRVRVGGTEMNPAVGTEFAFDSPDDQWESNSIERISNLLGSGTYTVEVEWAVVGGSSFRIDDWLFKVEFWRVS